MASKDELTERQRYWLGHVEACERSGKTTKANGLEPYAYLRQIFTRLPTAETVDDIEALLPFNIANEQTPS